MLALDIGETNGDDNEQFNGNRVLITYGPKQLPLHVEVYLRNHIPESDKKSRTVMLAILWAHVV